MFRLVLLTALVALASAGPKVRPRVPQLDGRIVGGVATTIQDHPYQLSLQYLGQHICGASIISTTKALTAAHCTDGTPASYLSVRASSTTRESGGQVVNVRSICQNPRYNPSTTDSDSSVLLLSGSITLGSGAQVIGLPSVGSEVPSGALAVVTGWGTLSSGGSLPTVLQEVSVPRVTDAACKSAYGSSAITARMSCYGYTAGGKDSCQGDSGGPLTYGGQQVGIVSWGYGCAEANYPGVYAKTSESSIQSQITGC